jgi:hypothetical protein
MRSTQLTHPARRLVAVLATVAAAGAISLAPAASSEASAATTPTCKPTHATGWEAAAKKANLALAGAVTSLQNQDYDTTVTKLRNLKRQARIATTGAAGEIGKPPTDPESDDPPGPTAVLKVARLEHQVTLKLVPLFDQLRGQAVGPLGSTLNVSAACRDALLGAVLAQRPAALDDYADGLSDTLPDYKKELTAFSTVLGSGVLVDQARTALSTAQQTVTATSDAMEKAFGGGERPTR